VASVFERAACDARNIGSLDADEPERAKSSFTPRVREQIFARDGHRCQVPGCRSSRNLEAHHIHPQALGGEGTVQNGTTICGGHHAAAHEGLIEITGRAPAIKVKWLIPIGTPIEVEEMRKMLLERELDELVSPSRHVPRGTSAGHCSTDDLASPSRHVPRGRSAGHCSTDQLASPSRDVPRGTPVGEPSSRLER
jgi:hypothetical protein